MIDKKDIIDFFDKCAKSWDEEMIRNEEVISTILDNAGVMEGISVLDVACGTGVLFDDYLSRGVARVTGVDISPEMTKRAAAKYDDPRVLVICSDIEDFDTTQKYDVVMLYNAFPHFPDPGKLIKKLADAVRPGGCLSIAHGMSRSHIDAHHSGSAHLVSVGLMSAEDLRDLMLEYFDVDVIISDDHMYQVCGRRKVKIV